jgi:hypothetical protein
MKIALMLAVITVVANVFLIRYAKKKCHKTKADGLSDPENDYNTLSCGYLNTPEAKRLKQSAASELNISVEELDRMSPEEITHMAREQKLISTSTN